MASTPDGQQRKDGIQLFVLSGPGAPELQELNNLPVDFKLLGTGRPDQECKSTQLSLCNLQQTIHPLIQRPKCSLLSHTGWSKQDWSKVEVLLKCGTGKDASTKQELQVCYMPAFAVNIQLQHTCTDGSWHQKMLFAGAADSCSTLAVSLLVLLAGSPNLGCLLNSCYLCLLYTATCAANNCSTCMSPSEGNFTMFTSHTRSTFLAGTLSSRSYSATDLKWVTRFWWAKGPISNPRWSKGNSV